MYTADDIIGNIFKTSPYAKVEENRNSNGISTNKTLELLGLNCVMMDIILSLLVLLLRFINFLTHPIYVYLAKGKKKVVPPVKNDLLKIAAADLAAKIRKKELSSEAVCKAYIERIKEVDPMINAVVEERFQQALREAKNVDDYLTKCSLNEDDLKKIKPLLGVPLTVKESCGLQGLSYAVGLVNRTGYKAESDGEAVAKLKSSGAIPLLVSNTPELCCCLESNNLITGRTNNPYDTTCTSGGSSGGEGALLGAGASVIGIGSDIAGSIRAPAMFNGIFGHKPTKRVVSIKGHFPYCYDEKFKDTLVIGPMTRYAKDLRLMMKILAGDKQTTHLKLNQKVDLSKVNIFFMEDNNSILETRVDDDIKLAIRTAVKYLNATFGAPIMEHKFKDIQYALGICVKDIMSIKDIPNPLKGENASLFTEIIKCIFGQSQYSPHLLNYLFLCKVFEVLVSDHTAEVRILREQLISSLGENGVLILPTIGFSANKHNESFFAASAVSYLAIANALGCPATSVPSGFDKNGMPISVQIIASPNQDRLCLAVAEELEKCFGGWIPPT